MSIAEAYAPPRPAARSYREHVRRTLGLAVPVTLARLGILLLVSVDTAMTGHAGATELAYYGLAMAPQVPMLLVGIGLLMGTVVLTAQAEGAGNTDESGRVWRIALLHATVYGAAMTALCYAGGPFLLLTGQAPDLAAGGGRVLIALGWGVPPLFLYTATVFFLEGLSRPLPGMVVMILANLLNLLLDWILIYGHLGLPAMGAVGAALATTAVRWFMFVAVAGYVLVAVDPERHGLRGRIPDALALARRFRRIGTPAGLAHGLESISFASMTLFAGLLGATQIAGYQVAMSLSAMVFMCAIGFGTAAGVRVANAVGRHDREGALVAGWIAVGLALLVQITFATVFLAAPGALTALYTDDPAVAAVAVPTVTLAAFVLVPDGTQGVLIGALRGAGDVWPATGLYLLAFGLVMMPTGYVLGVAHGGGAPALMRAVLVGTVTATLLMALRFRAVSRRALERA